MPWLSRLSAALASSVDKEQSQKLIVQSEPSTRSTDNKSPVRVRTASLVIIAARWVKRA
jgi:hypothetical protein